MTPAQKALRKIDRAIDDLDRFAVGTYGRRDAKAAISRSIDELIAARIQEALAALEPLVQQEK